MKTSAWKSVQRPGAESPVPTAADALSHLCSYYPLYPPQEDMAIDYENFYAYAQLPVTPDVFIVPSELRYFVKVGCAGFFLELQAWPSPLPPGSLGTRPS